MLPNELPEIIDPIQFCRQDLSGRASLFGTVVISKLNGVLSCEAENHPLLASLSLEFSVDEAGFCCIIGGLSASMPLVCQRCLERFEYPLTAKISVSPVASIEAAKQLPPQYEPLLLTQGKIRLRDWVAEELHLALPIIPKHASDCKVALDTVKQEAGCHNPLHPFEKLKEQFEKT